jgi:hypothetical protein
MIATAHIGELWRRFNAAGGTPVLTGFGGVIVTGVTGYFLQERKSEIEDRRLQRDAKRLRGEELYHLFDNWLMGIRKSAEDLGWKIQTEDHTLKDIELAYGDQQAYRRLICSLRHPSETSNLRSISIQKRNCRCCVQRIGEQMRDGRGEGDSLIARRIVDLRPNADDLRLINSRL